MPDCFSKSEVTDFLNFMKLPDGTSVVSDDLMEYLMAYGFFTAPASTKYHGNYEGGLLEHSYMVTKYLLTLTQDNHLIWRKSRSPYIVGMFHDLYKIDQYRHPASDLVVDGMLLPDPSKWEYNPDPPVEGIKEVIEQLISDGLCVVICSSRAESFEGQAAIAEWLKHYGFPMVQIQARKVPSIVHVDDRTICFDGRANNLYEQIINFKPWYERESESENH